MGEVFLNLLILALVVPFSNQATKAKQSEAKTYIGAMNRAQQAYYLENNKFSSEISDLGIGINDETENYQYQVNNDGNPKKTVATARAKNDSLRSYTGAVFIIKSPDGFDTTTAVICQTNQPSQIPPGTPELIGDEIQCSSGSSKLY